MAEPLSPATEELGKRIRDFRNELAVTQETISQGSGLDTTTIGKIERGERNPNLHNLIRIATAMGVDPGELVRGMTKDMVPQLEARRSPVDILEERIRERDAKRRAEGELDAR
jgi:transcriptional regulator with XRE-family HTH domain